MSVGVFVEVMTGLNLSLQRVVTAEGRERVSMWFVDYFGSFRRKTVRAIKLFLQTFPWQTFES
jgi:hypothetical protein